MDFAAIIAIPLGLVEAFGAMPNGPLIAAVLLWVMSATFTALSIPGTIVPMSFTSGVLLGLPGMFVISTGALVGSVGLFVVTRRSLSEWMRRKFGPRLDVIGEVLHRRGPLYVVGARVTGVPNLLVTAGSAITPISTPIFAVATLLGMAPAIVLAVLAGSAI